MQISKSRLAVLTGLSGGTKPKCVCCNETRLWCLAIDHRYGGGRRHRIANGYAPVERLVRREYNQTGVWNMNKYRILCHNCNHGAAQRGGLCPHNDEYDPRTEWVS